MARKGTDGIAVVCPIDGHGEKGYDGMPCPECGTPMVPDTDFADTERSLVATEKEDPLAGDLAHDSLDASEDDPYRTQSLEDLAHDEFAEDEKEGHEF